MALILEPLKNGVRMELLWTNPNPDASFGPQTVELDLSRYDAVLANGYRPASSAIAASVFVPVGQRGQFCVTGSGRTAWRAFEVTQDGIDFEKGLMDDGATGNSYAIPFLIYGIRL